MKSIKTICFIIAFLIAGTSQQLKSQDKQSELIKGVPVSVQLKSGEKHRYAINIDAGKFAFFRLEQKGIDAGITTFDPDGRKLQSFDSPNGSNGDEPVTLFTEKKGTYILEVTSLEEKGKSGYYKLTWERIEPKGTTPDKLIDQLFSVWNNPETPGAAVAVEKDGKILFKKGYGSAELEYAVPITPSTVFHIASVSKQFTCFSILLLEKEGKLSINDDVRKYIPEVPDFGKVITLSNLMHHTSGLRDQWELLSIAGWRLDDIITKDQILRIVSQQKELNFSPGDQFMYCNTGFTLLAEVVARVSGQSFPDFTRTHIFEPLKMKNTLFYDDCEKIVKNRAYSFYMDTTGYKKSNLNYSNVGATSLFTTAEDLTLWAGNFENPVIGGKDVIERMNIRGILNKGDTITYAMGQDIGKYKGLKIIQHGGADAGYRSFLVRFPDQNFSVNVLSNLAFFDPGGMAFKVADLYLKDMEKPESEKKKDPESKPAVNSKEIKIDHDSLVSFSGRYEAGPGFVVAIILENEGLYVDAQDLKKAPMIPVSLNEFEISAVQARVRFIKDAAGKTTGMLVKMNGQEHLAPRLPDFDPSGVDLTEYTGTYFSPELSTTYSLVVESGKLIARHFRTGDIILTPSKPDNFSGNRWYFSRVDFFRDGNSKVTGLRLNGERVRNLKFDRVVK